MEWKGLDSQQMTGRNRRLLMEWKAMDEHLAVRNDVDYVVSKRNFEGLPVRFLITYHIHSIAGVVHPEELNHRDFANPPVFADDFILEIVIPPGYPCIDAPADFHFLTHDEHGNSIAHPWHPNIRYFGQFSGRVCLNALDSFTSLVWGVERIALYLRYELYHAWPEPPYPEDMKVAEWVIKQGEPRKWIFFDQEEPTSCVK